MVYDSSDATKEHRLRVMHFLGLLSSAMDVRGVEHDESKLCRPEKPIFDKYTPKLKGADYGSEDYKRFLAEMKPALDHHYKVNRHHPEHFANGLAGMNLVDLAEMICDWVAASERHENGDPLVSVSINQARFGYSEDLASILRNTVRLLKSEED